MSNERKRTLPTTLPPRHSRRCKVCNLPLALRTETDELIAAGRSMRGISAHLRATGHLLSHNAVRTHRDALEAAQADPVDYGRLPWETAGESPQTDAKGSEGKGTGGAPIVDSEATGTAETGIPGDRGFGDGAAGGGRDGSRPAAKSRASPPQGPTRKASPDKGKASLRTRKARPSRDYRPPERRDPPEPPGAIRQDIRRKTRAATWGEISARETLRYRVEQGWSYREIAAVLSEEHGRSVTVRAVKAAERRALDRYLPEADRETYTRLLLARTEDIYRRNVSAATDVVTANKVLLPALRDIARLTGANAPPPAKQHQHSGQVDHRHTHELVAQLTGQLLPAVRGYILAHPAQSGADLWAGIEAELRQLRARLVGGNEAGKTGDVLTLPASAVTESDADRAASAPQHTGGTHPKG